MENISDLYRIVSNDRSVRQHASKVFVYQDETLVFEFPVLVGTAALDVAYNGESIQLSLVGRGAEVQKTLRNAFLGEFEIRQLDGERLQIHESWILDNDEDLVKEIVLMINYVQKSIVNCLSYVPPESIGGQEPLQIFWWDHISNFGDLIGPMVVSGALDVKPLNARQRLRSGRTLYSVGSVTAMIDRNDATVWGSGLLAPLSDQQIVSLRRRSGIEVLAVRGKYTQLELEAKLGWSVPDVFGDPALLLPQFYEPRQISGSASTAVVMHWEHAKYIRGNGNDELNIINVGDDAKFVIDQIANSKVCISTSLHGIIVAQAYGIPWVWLQIADHKLHSSDFKFDDFLTTLNRREVSKKSISKTDISNLDWAKLATTATLPKLTIDPNQLLDSLLTWRNR